jgi:hypothetical protein
VRIGREKADFKGETMKASEKFKVGDRVTMTEEAQLHFYAESRPRHYGIIMAIDDRHATVQVEERGGGKDAIRGFWHMNFWEVVR